MVGEVMQTYIDLWAKLASYIIVYIYDILVDIRFINT
jgi:hypothetical protein